MISHIHTYTPLYIPVSKCFFFSPSLSFCQTRSIDCFSILILLAGDQVPMLLRSYYKHKAPPHTKTSRRGNKFRKCQVKKLPKSAQMNSDFLSLFFLIGHTGRGVSSAVTGKGTAGAPRGEAMRGEAPAKLWERLRTRGHCVFLFYFDSHNWRIQASTQVARGRLSAVRGDGGGGGGPRARRPQTPYVNVDHSFCSCFGAAINIPHVPSIRPSS